VKKTFLRGGERQRAAAGRSVKIRSPDFRQKKFGFRPTNTTVQKLGEMNLRSRGFDPFIAHNKVWFFILVTGE